MKIQKKLVWTCLSLTTTAFILFLTGVYFASGVSSAASFEWPSPVLEKYASGLSSPTHITHAGDGSGRLFVVEQKGTIRVIKQGKVQTGPFLDISSRVSCCNERGLLSVAFPPNYASKGYFYVDYTDISGDTVIARYKVGSSPDIADSGSEEVLLRIDQPFANHNGGQLAFGPDGYLYVGMGDGGSGGDPDNNAQNSDSLLGKILRIDVESGTIPYSIPASNPFANISGYKPEIWALGLRNPWRFSFDRETGDLYIADVGQKLYEEIDYQSFSSKGGENYGWRITEGLHCYNPDPCSTSGLTLPVAEYDHSQGCAVTGGTIYRGARYLRMKGIYFYGDYCSRTIWGLKKDGSSWFSNKLASTSHTISTFGEDEDGELYLADHSDGNIYRITDDLKGDSGGCFITATYGLNHPSLKTFKKLRSYFQKTPLGNSFVVLFYKCSPKVKMALARHEGLRTAIKSTLDLIAFIIEKPFVFGLISVGGLFGLVLSASLLSRYYRKETYGSERQIIDNMRRF